MVKPTSSLSITAAAAVSPVVRPSCTPSFTPVVGSSSQALDSQLAQGLTNRSGMVSLPLVSDWSTALASPSSALPSDAKKELAESVKAFQRRVDECKPKRVGVVLILSWEVLGTR